MGCPYGFRIAGPCTETRRLVNAAAALSGHAACDDRAEVNRESYLSAFTFGEDFRRHLEATGSTAGYAGPCWSPWLWIDLDAEDLRDSHRDAQGLVDVVVDLWGIDPALVLIFFSGSKGFHIGLPTSLWEPEPSADFHRQCRHMAVLMADGAGVTIDTGVYDRVRAFRAPNSRHPKTGLHKVRLTFDELFGRLDAILEKAKEPAPFVIPEPPPRNEDASESWNAAVEQAKAETEAKAARCAAGIGATLNRSTLAFIRDGAAQGDRHRLLYSTAANLAECGCPQALAFALLEESALDSGLPPKDVRRGIECGFAAVGSASTPRIAPGPTQAVPDGSTVKEPPEVAASNPGSPEGQSCQGVPRAPEPAADLQAPLAKLWQSAPTAKCHLGKPRPLPPRTIGSGKLDKPCRCGSMEYVEVSISKGRTRLDCRHCTRFIRFGTWHNQGGLG